MTPPKVIIISNIVAIDYFYTFAIWATNRHLHRGHRIDIEYFCAHRQPATPIKILISTLRQEAARRRHTATGRSRCTADITLLSLYLTIISSAYEADAPEEA